MSYNGSGTFNINSAGQPVVVGTVITDTAFNLLTADLATGLSTALTKDGQTTPTANIPMGTFKLTNLGAGTAVADAVRLSQLQNFGTTTLVTISGTNTITGTVSPSLTAYVAGQVFSFIVSVTNTGPATLSIDGLGAKAITKTGTIALEAGDMVSGQVILVQYDGTQFQIIGGAKVAPSPITNSLGADVALNNTANYFDGPSIAQGTSGTWFVSGSVTVYDTVVPVGINAKLWDGTTVIASANMSALTAGNPIVIALSGYIASPAGNLRISVKDLTAITGKILFNQSGNSKDSTITAIRIA